MSFSCFEVQASPILEPVSQSIELDEGYCPHGSEGVVSDEQEAQVRADFLIMYEATGLIDRERNRLLLAVADHGRPPERSTASSPV